MSQLKPKLLYLESMTEPIANVLPHLKELRDIWHKQDFHLNREQQEQYDLLIATRRERVRQLYAQGQVYKGSYKPKAEDF